MKDKQDGQIAKNMSVYKLFKCRVNVTFVCTKSQLLSSMEGRGFTNILYNGVL